MSEPRNIQLPVDFQNSQVIRRVSLLTRDVYGDVTELIDTINKEAVKIAPEILRPVWIDTEHGMEWKPENYEMTVERLRRSYIGLLKKTDSDNPRDNFLFVKHSARLAQDWVEAAYLWHHANAKIVESS